MEAAGANHITCHLHVDRCDLKRSAIAHCCTESRAYVELACIYIMSWVHVDNMNLTGDSTKVSDLKCKLTIEQSHTQQQGCMGTLGAGRPWREARGPGNGCAETLMACLTHSPRTSMKRSAQKTHVDGVHVPAYDIGLTLTEFMGQHVTLACRRRGSWASM